MENIAWSGIGISPEDAFRLQLSLCRLSKKYETANFRFWGKILGTEHDYFIIEAQNVEDTEYEREHAKDYESNGPNSFTYFVSNYSIFFKYIYSW